MKKLTKDERAKLEKLIDARVPVPLIADLTGWSTSLIYKLKNGNYDELLEKNRQEVARKAKMQSSPSIGPGCEAPRCTDKVSDIGQCACPDEDEAESTEKLLKDIKNILLSIRMLVKNSYSKPNKKSSELEAQKGEHAD